MNLDKRYTLLRDKLDNLGFSQPLPIGALSIVSSILDELIFTSNSLQNAKQKINALKEEKKAWELGNEPLKCDNSKLLAECNALHTDILRQRDEFQCKLYEVNKTVRNLQKEKRCLLEFCEEAKQKISELQSNKQIKTQTSNENRKPFISTVRSGSFLLPSTKENECDGGISCWRCCTKRCKHAQLEKLNEQNHTKDIIELTEMYKKQLESRDREIKRLNKLLVGGRPSLALAEDCCYRDIGTLSDDMQRLQKEKAWLQQQHELCLRKKDNNEDRALSLDEENRKLHEQLRDIENEALNAEKEANNNLAKLHEQNNKLKNKVNEKQQYIEQLKAKLGVMAESSSLEIDFSRLKTAYENAQAEIKQLMKVSYEKDIEKDQLYKKYTKLKTKFVKMQKNSTEYANVRTIPIGSSCVEIGNNSERLEAERNYYQEEYLQLLKHHSNDKELNSLRSLLAKNQYESKLRHQLTAHAQLTEPLSLHLDRDDQSECELSRDAEKRCDEKHIHKLQEDIANLNRENESLRLYKASSAKELNSLRERIINTEKNNLVTITENSHLKQLNNQLKALQERTENSLIDHQSRLSQAESRLDMVDSSRNQVCNEIDKLRAEIEFLRSNNASLQAEREKLTRENEEKAEKLLNARVSLHQIESKNLDLESQAILLRREIDEANSQQNQNVCSLQRITQETETLHKQLQQLRRSYDNAMAENARLTRNLADLECDQCLNKTKLVEAEKEIGRTKQQLQQYMKEVERVEDLLSRKEEERQEMLEHYRSLSQSANTNVESAVMKALDRHGEELSDTRVEFDEHLKPLTIWESDDIA